MDISIYNALKSALVSTFDHKYRLYEYGETIDWSEYCNATLLVDNIQTSSGMCSSTIFEDVRRCIDFYLHSRGYKRHLDRYGLKHKAKREFNHFLTQVYQQFPLTHKNKKKTNR